MLNLNYKTVKAMSETLRRLNNLRRWSYIQDQPKYNELNKQALNCLCVFAIANYAEQAGQEIDWTCFPKIAIYRSFQKVYVNFDTREEFLEDMCEIGRFEKDIFQKTSLEIISERSTKEFAEFLQDCLGTKEFRIYKAASKVATYIELLEHKSVISMGTYSAKYAEVLSELRQYYEISGVKEMEKGNYWFNIIQEISTLRNHARWCELAYTVQCSILGHLFDVACFSYLMSLEKHQDEKLATKHFFMGLIHDIAETWTTDVPSSIKDRIRGFRAVTEKYEEKMLEKHLYSRLSDFMEQKVKEVMFEDPKNVEHFKLIKGADYLAADLECWKMYVAGSKDSYFLGAIKRRIVGIESGKVELTPICLKLYQYFMKESEKFMFSPLEYTELQHLCIKMYHVYAFEENCMEKLEQLRPQFNSQLEGMDKEEWEDIEDMLLMFFGSEELLEEITG